jgi:hypothetical protein
MMRHYALVLLVLALAGCESIPPAPPKPASLAVAGEGQRVNGTEIRSVHAPYAVLIKKLNQGDLSLADLAAHGLPVTVVFANLSNQPVEFGPDNIVVHGVGNAGRIAVLSADDIEKIKQDEQSGNNSSSIFDVLLAVAGTAQTGRMMQNGTLSQAQATAVAQGISTLAVTDIADNQAQNQKIQQDEATLVEHYQAVVLEETTVNPHQQIGGVVFLRNASPDSTLSIGVTTGNFTHQFSYLPPERIAEMQEQARAQSGQNVPVAVVSDTNAGR